MFQRSVFVLGGGLLRCLCLCGFVVVGIWGGGVGCLLFVLVKIGMRIRGLINVWWWLYGSARGQRRKRERERERERVHVVRKRTFSFIS